MNNCYRTKWVRCAKNNKAQSFNNGGAKLKKEEFERERERERELIVMVKKMLHWINWLQTLYLYNRLESGKQGNNNWFIKLTSS